MAKRTCTIVFPYTPPPRLNYVITAAHVITFIVVLMINALLAAKVLAAVCLLFSVLAQRRLWRHMFSVNAVNLDESTVTLLIACNSINQTCREESVRVLEIFATRFLVVLSYRLASDSRWRRHALLVTPQSMLPGDFRRFRIALNTLSSKVFHASRDAQ